MNTNVIFVACAVTLAGNTSEMFRGFLVVAMNGGQRVGSFTPAGANGQVACSVSVLDSNRGNTSTYSLIQGAKICH